MSDRQRVRGSEREGFVPDGREKEAAGGGQADSETRGERQRGQKGQGKRLLFGR